MSIGIHCNIIKDLLPLYIDDVCSEESKEIIETHILNCEDCRSEVISMKSDIPPIKIEENLDKAKSIIKISKKWKREMRKYLLEGVVVAVTVLILFLILYIFVGVDVIPKAI